jgi:hypothetical protein
MEELQSPQSTMNGTVSTEIRKRGRPAKNTVGSIKELVLPIVATSVTDMDLNEISDETPMYFISAQDTTNDGCLSTVWTKSPNTYVEEGSKPLTNKEWLQLPPHVIAKLRIFSAARSEDPQATLDVIMHYLNDQQDDRAWGPMIDALTFYLENYT